MSQQTQGYGDERQEGTDVHRLCGKTAEVEERDRRGEHRGLQAGGLWDSESASLLDAAMLQLQPSLSLSLNLSLSVSVSVSVSASQHSVLCCAALSAAAAASARLSLLSLTGLLLHHALPSSPRCCCLCYLTLSLSHTRTRAPSHLPARASLRLHSLPSQQLRQVLLTVT